MNNVRTITGKRLAAGIAATSLVLAACGAGTETEETGTEATFEVTPQASTSDGDRPTLQHDATESTALGDSGSEEGADQASDGSAGSGDGESTDTPNNDTPIAIPTNGKSTLGSTVLAATMEQSEISSARFEATIEIVSTEFDQPMIMTMSGGFDQPNDAMEMYMDMSAMADLMASQDAGASEFAELFSADFHVIQIGDQAWVKSGMLAFFGIEPDQWLESDASEDSGDAGFGDLSSGFGSPEELLSHLEDAEAEIEELGRENVRGVDTRHFRATIDVGALAQELSDDELAELRESLGDVSDTAIVPMDFWIGDDGLLYRFSVTADASELGEADEEIESMSIVYEMYDYGAELGISPPDPALVVDEESLSWD